MHDVTNPHMLIKVITYILKNRKETEMEDVMFKMC